MQHTIYERYTHLQRLFENKMKQENAPIVEVSLLNTLEESSM